MSAFADYYTHGQNKNCILHPPPPRKKQQQQQQQQQKVTTYTWTPQNSFYFSLLTRE